LLRFSLDKKKKKIKKTIFKKIKIKGCFQGNAKKVIAPTQNRCFSITLKAKEKTLPTNETIQSLLNPLSALLPNFDNLQVTRGPGQIQISIKYVDVNMKFDLGLDKGIQERSQLFEVNLQSVLVLMSKMRSIPGYTFQNPTCEFKEASLHDWIEVNDLLMSTNMLQLFIKRNDLLLDKFSVNHPLLFKQPGEYVLVPAVIKQIRTDRRVLNILQETTLLNTREFVNLKKIFKPTIADPDQSVNVLHRILWQGIPEELKRNQMDAKITQLEGLQELFVTLIER